MSEMTMELKEFVNETLRQIRAGVAQAQGTSIDDGRDINPRITNFNPKDNIRMTNKDRVVESVEFDVALTTEDASGKKAGLGIFVAPLSVGVQGTAEQKSITVNRVKFSVPMAYPAFD